MKIKLLRLEVKSARWPWQGYGWFPHKNGTGPKAILNPTGARFGGGWKYSLGIQVSDSTVLLNLLFGTITFRKI